MARGQEYLVNATQHDGSDALADPKTAVRVRVSIDMPKLLKHLTLKAISQSRGRASACDHAIELKVLELP